ncbi:YncE family protein [uncultured Bacteroides sp.]|uniref:YncE family protein n=1 Tax=uncultured Bacteroides sp. TaxID=162156 RepID=UPI0026201990|nr:DUF5074 domain-containing protein [uncultured Bacteroides sp.]
MKNDYTYIMNCLTGKRYFRKLPLMPALLCICILLLSGCRGELPVLNSEKEYVTYPAATQTIKGFFLLNEGNMGSNKCTIDYFNYQEGYYLRNIYPESNPDVVKELGDVGNDIQIHDGKLYAVVNCSNLVEVMDVRTARHLGSVNIPNCRYITFNGDKAYVSSYAGPVQIDPEARPGKIVEFDTRTLQITREVTVGYQPEDLVITNGRLYVANSGGYRFPNYDRTVSVVDLNSFKVVNTIDVAINLHRMELDKYGRIYVTSRGDYNGIGSDVYIIDSKTETVAGSLGVSANEMHLCGDSLYIIGSEGNNQQQDNHVSYTLYDISLDKVVSSNFITDGTDREIKLPYGLAVNPETKEIYLTDATDYVTPGYLFCFSPEGKMKWKVRTGDIPAHIVFTTENFYYGYNGELPDTPEDNHSPYITKVLDFLPAPGQFVNTSPSYTAGDTQETMNQKAFKAIGENRRGLVSLGGFGGYIVVGFDHTIENKSGLRDFRVIGNAFSNGAGGGSYEPGVVMVSHDSNGNGLPDDEWYEIAGSAHQPDFTETWYGKAQAAGNDVTTHYNYEITYYRPEQEPSGSTEEKEYIHWTDNLGREGYIPKIIYHTQPYYPQWITAEKLTFKGTCLPQNAINEGTADQAYHVLYPFSYGYADNAPYNTAEACIDIDWAIDVSGNKVNLPGVDFIKIYTGVNQVNGWIGECSTEVSGIEDLHILGEKIETR